MKNFGRNMILIWAKKMEIHLLKINAFQFICAHTLYMRIFHLQGAENGIRAQLSSNRLK